MVYVGLKLIYLSLRICKSVVIIIFEYNQYSNKCNKSIRKQNIKLNKKPDKHSKNPNNPNRYNMHPLPKKKLTTTTHATLMVLLFFPFFFLFFSFFHTFCFNHTLILSLFIIDCNQCFHFFNNFIISCIIFMIFCKIFDMIVSNF